MNILHEQFESYRREYQALRYSGRLADEVSLSPSRLRVFPWLPWVTGLAAAVVLMIVLLPKTQKHLSENLPEPVAFALPSTQALENLELSPPSLPEGLFDVVVSWPREAGTVPTLPSFQMWDGQSERSLTSTSQESV